MLFIKKNQKKKKTTPSLTKQRIRKIPLGHHDRGVVLLALFFQVVVIYQHGLVGHGLTKRTEAFEDWSQLLRFEPFWRLISY